MLFQEAEGQLFNPTVEAEVAWGIENLGLPVAEIERRLAWALHAMDLEALREASPGTLSGGQQKRVALAATLAMQPAPDPRRADSGLDRKRARGAGRAGRLRRVYR
jgi:energy-coupling factor transport system ATP-binding protein